MDNKTEDNNDLVKDLVCGMVKPKSEMKAQMEYKGTIYYFCSEGDKQMFAAYPDRWVPKTSSH